MEANAHSRLFYHGTSIEVQLGDIILYKRFLRKGIEGVVAYIPGMSYPHPDLEYEKIKQWLIKLTDGTMLVMGYFPPKSYPVKSIT